MQLKRVMSILNGNLRLQSPVPSAWLSINKTRGKWISSKIYQFHLIKALSSCLKTLRKQLCKLTFSQSAVHFLTTFHFDPWYWIFFLRPRARNRSSLSVWLSARSTMLYRLPTSKVLAPEMSNALTFPSPSVPSFKCNRWENFWRWNHSPYGLKEPSLHSSRGSSKKNPTGDSGKNDKFEKSVAGGGKRRLSFPNGISSRNMDLPVAIWADSIVLQHNKILPRRNRILIDETRTRTRFFSATSGFATSMLRFSSSFQY